MRRVFALLLISLLAFLSAGCGSEAPDSAKDAVELVYVVDLCFINDEFSGDEDGPEPAMRYYQNQHIYAVEGKQYFTLLDEVLRENPFGSDSLGTMITEKIQFNSVVVRDGTAFVDLKGENLSGSSFEEGLLISQIVITLMGSFSEVERVQFLVDGEITESLMGHYDATEPFEDGIYSIK